MAKKVGYEGVVCTQCGKSYPRIKFNIFYDIYFCKKKCKKRYYKNPKHCLSDKEIDAVCRKIDKFIKRINEMKEELTFETRQRLVDVLK